MYVGKYGNWALRGRPEPTQLVSPPETRHSGASGLEITRCNAGDAEQGQRVRGLQVEAEHGLLVDHRPRSRAEAGDLDGANLHIGDPIVEATTRLLSSSTKRMTGLSSRRRSRSIISMTSMPFLKSKATFCSKTNLLGRSGWSPSNLGSRVRCRAIMLDGRGLCGKTLAIGH